MNSSQAAITLKDVAEAAGVSVTTASRALSNPDLVSDQTRQRVAAVAERLGYRPNVMARDLRRAETGVVLVVVPRLSPYFLDIFRGVEAVAAAFGYNVLVGHTDRDSEREAAFVDQVSSRRADGVILASAVDSAQLLARAHVPPVVVALDECGMGVLPSVAVDHAEAAAAATSHLLALGHTQLAHIQGAVGSKMAAERARGFEAALAAAGVPMDPEFRVPGDFTVESGERGMERLLALPRRPTAVFAANDEMAIGALRAIRRMGLNVPRDLSLVGFDDQRIAALSDPPLTTVSVPTAELGARAMEQLSRLMAGERVERRIVLPTRLAIRASTARPPWAAA